VVLAWAVLAVMVLLALRFWREPGLVANRVRNI